MIGVPPLRDWHAMVAVAVVTVASLLVEARNLIFNGDEWDFIQRMPTEAGTLMLEPHNGHWSTVPVLIYQALLATVGLRSYIPYLLILLVLHAMCACLVYALARRRHGHWIALWLGCMLLVFGNGGENIFWAFQIGFVGSVLCGLTAWWALDRQVPWAAAAALVVGVMSSGIGLVFIVAIGTNLLLERRRRRWAWAVVPAVLAFFLWYVTLGRGGPGIATESVLLAGSPPQRAGSLIAFVADGLSGTVFSLGGLYHRWGNGLVSGAIVAALVGAVMLGHRRRVMTARTWGALAGVLSVFVLTGAVRSQLGVETASSGRYLYVAAAASLVALGSLELRLGIPPVLRPPMHVAAALALVGNLGLLQLGLIYRDARARYQLEEIQTVEAFRGVRGVVLGNRADPILLDNLTTGLFYRATDLYGEPVRNPGLGGIARFDAISVDRTVERLFHDNLPVQPRGDVTCAPGADVGVSATTRASVVIATDDPGPVLVFIWLADKRDAWGVGTFQGPGAATALLPATNGQLTWHVGAVSRLGGRVRLCL